MGFQFLLVLHLLGSSIWVGGHLILALTILPRALRTKNPDLITSFEIKYEKVGVPSLLLQLVTGILLTYYYVDNFFDVFDFAYVQHSLIAMKLLLMATTIIIALHARLRVISNLKTENLRFLAIHIVAVTIISVLLLTFGGLVRIGVQL